MPTSSSLYLSIIVKSGIRLKEIEIRRLPSGVFAADLIFTDGTQTHTVDSRSSDAIALAIRADAPIYTSAEVLDEAGFDPEEQERARQESPAAGNPKTQSARMKAAKDSLEILKARMQKAAEKEDYEEAARIKAQIDALSDNGMNNTDE